jgi:hypothetical protein
MDSSEEDDSDDEEDHVVHKFCQFCCSFLIDTRAPYRYDFSRRSRL